MTMKNVGHALVYTHPKETAEALGQLIVNLAEKHNS